MAKRKKKLMSAINPIISSVNQDTEQTAKASHPSLRIMGRRLTYPVIRGKQLSHIHLLAFVVIFAVIGSTLVFFSQAATSTIATMEAENMTLPAGASVVSDNTASPANGGGKAVVLTQVGTSMSSTVNLTSPAESLTVTAKGTKCKGTWPSMTVSVGGVTVIGPTQVASSSWKGYSATKALPAGSQALDIKYTAGRAGCESKMYVDVTNFYGPASDTSAPAASVLTAIGGDQQAALSWTMATDNVGINRYEIWKNDSYLTGLGSSVLTYTAHNLLNDQVYKFRVVAYDDAGNYINSNDVIVTPKAVTAPVASAGCPAGASPATFPSRLKTSGRQIVDENGCVMPKLKGFSVYLNPSYTHSQSDFNDMAALGAKINRATIHWDEFEPTQGNIDPTGLDLHIARAQAAGMYTMLELHLNIGKDPGWTAGYSDEMEKYSHYGQTITQYLANRYGNPASPKYNKSVIGFGLNEPPLGNATIRNGNNAIPYMETKQQQMISWMRAPGYAPSWIGFVAEAYAGATPLYDHSWQNANATDASPTAYNAVGGNIIYDLHDYMMGCAIPGTTTLSTDPNCDGRQWNGQNYPIYQGGPQIGTEQNAFSAYMSTAVSRGQFAAYLKPYKTFTTQANVPLMIGEWGWTAGKANEVAFVNDKKAAWADAGTSIEIYWDYNATPNTSEDPWASRPGGAWRPSILEWVK